MYGKRDISGTSRLRIANYDLFRWHWVLSLSTNSSNKKTHQKITVKRNNSQLGRKPLEINKQWMEINLIWRIIFYPITDSAKNQLVEEWKGKALTWVESPRIPPAVRWLTPRGPGKPRNRRPYKVEARCRRAATHGKTSGEITTSHKSRSYNKWEVNAPIK